MQGRQIIAPIDKDDELFAAIQDEIPMRADVDCITTLWEGSTTNPKWLSETSVILKRHSLRQWFELSHARLICKTGEIEAVFAGWDDKYDFVAKQNE